ncbi:uncharacterized protein LOC105698373 [Orussus abietinus]|uniref:uncharacterized protein LOC105698373 n=1 Tax=Orussus abietinus TaxID=222816 RepID=UPI0006267CA3|nr:uncharacterized protein LOC105698373 [Orussus abietinus]
MKNMASWLSILLAISLSRAVSSNFIGCDLPTNFVIDISEDVKVNIYGAELWVGIKPEDVGIVRYPYINAVNLVANNSIIAFRGYLIKNNLKDRLISGPENISRHLNIDRTVGLAQVIRNACVPDEAYRLRDCVMFLSPARETKDDVLKKVDREILKLAESCLSTEICEKFDHQKFVEIPLDDPDQFGPLSPYSRSLYAALPPNKQFSPSAVGRENCESVQSAINILVDVALAELIERLRKKNEGIIKIPDIYQEFSTGSGIFETTGRFEAINGTFKDLTTLKRTEDAILSNAGLKFKASCGFGLSTAQLQYPYYKAKFGILKVNGQISGTVAGTAIHVTVIVDYNQNPCVTTLDTLKVTEFGKAKINITGLGPLNWLTSKLLNYVAKTWREDVIKSIESKLRNTVTKQLNKFNCEKYRP